MPRIFTAANNRRYQPYKTAEELYRACQPSYRNAGGFIEEPEPATVEKSYSDFSDNEDDGRDGSSDVTAATTSAQLVCVDCSKNFTDSFLYRRFGHRTCDACRDSADKHKLITLSDAKKYYLLKNCDFDSRQPRLRFLRRKNPHSPRGGDMKLYLQLQVEERAFEIWGGVEGLERAIQARETSKEIRKQHQFENKMKELKKQARNDLFFKKKVQHIHSYGEETLDDRSSSYSKTCTTCGHVLKYEKI